jgi:hypothetical protein
LLRWNLKALVSADPAQTPITDFRPLFVGNPVMKAVPSFHLFYLHFK